MIKPITCVMGFIVCREMPLHRSFWWGIGRNGSGTLTVDDELNESEIIV